MGKSSCKELRAFAKRMKALGADVPKILTELAMHEGEEIAGMIKENTPHITGNLKNNFHSGNDTLYSAGNNIIIKIVNNTEYASFVEKGHRKVDKSGKTVGWVQGRFMMRLGVRKYKDEIMDGNIHRFIEKKLNDYVKDR